MNIYNLNYAGSVNVNCTFHSGGAELFLRFMQAVEERNQRMKALLGQLAEAVDNEEKQLLLTELSGCQQANEQDLELYKKLL